MVVVILEDNMKNGTSDPTPSQDIMVSIKESSVQGNLTNQLLEAPGNLQSEEI